MAKGELLAGAEAREMPTDDEGFRISNFMSKSGRGWTLVGVLLACLCIAHVIFSKHELGLLETWYLDNLRHFRCVQEFASKGFWIYSHPMEEFARIGDQRAYIWPQVGYLYPPGALLFFAPFSWLYYNAGFSIGLVSKLSLCVMVVFWHLACLVPLISRRITSSLGYCVWAFVYMQGLFWTLNGQYEGLPMLFITLAAAHSGQDPYRLQKYLSLAIFVKFQALLYLPFFLRDVTQSIAKDGLKVYCRRLFLSWWFWTIPLSAVSLYFCRAYLSPSKANSIGWQLLSTGDLKTWVCLSLALFFSTLLLAKKRPLMATILFFNYAMFASLSQLQDWYMCFLCGFPLFAKDTTEGDLGFAFLLCFFWAYGSLSGPYHLLSHILASH